jgi:hypothetical protein
MTSSSGSCTQSPSSPRSRSLFDSTRCPTISRKAPSGGGAILRTFFFTMHPTRMVRASYELRAKLLPCFRVCLVAVLCLVCVFATIGPTSRLHPLLPITPLTLLTLLPLHYSHQGMTQLASPKASKYSTRRGNGFWSYSAGFHSVCCW